jgi:hypothetical protein
MDIAVFSSQELPFVLQTLTTVAAKPEALTPLEHQFLQVVNQLHQASVVVDDLSAITPTQIAAAITDPHHRKRLLQMAMVMAMVDNEITPSQQKALRRRVRAACPLGTQRLVVRHRLQKSFLVTSKVYECCTKPLENISC